MHYQIWGNNVRHGIQFYKVSFCASDTNVVGNLYIETVIPVIVMSSAVHYAALSPHRGCGLSLSPQLRDDVSHCATQGGAKPNNHGQPHTNHHFQLNRTPVVPMRYTNLEELGKAARQATGAVSGFKPKRMVDLALSQIEQYKQMLEMDLELAAYHIFQAREILFVCIPRHPDYDKFQAKKGPFHETYVELCDLAETDRRVLELISTVKGKYVREKTSGVRRQSNDDLLQSIDDTIRGFSHLDVQQQSAPPTETDPLKDKLEKLRGRSPEVQRATLTTNGSSTTTTKNGVMPPPKISPPPVPVPQNGGYVRQSYVGPASVPSPPPHSVTPPTPPRHTITLKAPQLISYLGHAPETLLLLDIRPRADFQKCHIAAPNVVCVEPHLLEADMTDEQVEEKMLAALTTEEFERFMARSAFEIVVFYDQNSTSYQTRPLKILLKALYSQAFKRPLQRPPCLLVGGLDEWRHSGAATSFIDTRSPLQQRAELARTQTDPTPVASYDPNRVYSHPYASNYASYAYSYGPNQSSPTPPPVPTTPPPKPPSAMSSSSSLNLPQSMALSSSTSLPDPSSYKNQMYSCHPYLNEPLPESRHHTHGVSQPAQAARSSHGYYSHALPQLSVNTASSPIKQPPSAYSPKEKHNGEFPSYKSVRQPIPQSPYLPHLAPMSGSPPPMSLTFTTGLKNLGNTCYINCIIQCLATSQLTKIIVNQAYKHRVNMKSKLGYKGALIAKYADLVQALVANAYPYLVPTSFKGIIAHVNSQFSGMEQHDCQEFLTFILDGLHEELNSVGDGQYKPRELTESEEKRREEMSVRIVSSLEWERYLKSASSFIVDEFQGQYQSKLQCTVCKMTSTTYTAFSSLTLPIPKYAGATLPTLYDCFNQFTQPELLEGENMWQCPTCKKPRPTIKSMKISRLPETLIIHLKRFDHSRGYGDKLNTFVTYPLEMDLTRYWPPPTSEDEPFLKKLLPRGQTAPFRYSLFGVANHYGTLRGGHYTSFCKRGKLGWCYFDDTVVNRNVNERAVVNKNAYVLFYQRRHNP
ncbi:uncharacterized protein YALI1_F20669g [Yarrowia lipolytica]|nr:hypothetical protein YALI1_F20669g [Yarrowia lipolytica]